MPLLTETQTATLPATITLPEGIRFANIVPTNPHHTHLADQGAANTSILVTGMLPHSDRVGGDHIRIEDVLGRVVPVRPNQFRTGWYYNPGTIDADGHRQRGIYVTGPEINPAPRNGHFYAEIVPRWSSNLDVPFTLRWNDQDHASQRAYTGNPWTIVASHDSTAGNAVGQQRFVTPRLWVEVLDPADTPPTMETLDLDQIFSTDLAEPTPVVTGVDNTATGPTLGKAHVEEDGSVLLDPEPEIGGMYLTWYDGGTDWFTDHVMVHSYYGEFNTIGYFHRGLDGEVRHVTDSWVSPSTRGTKHWAKLALTSAEPNTETEAARLATLQERLLSTHDNFEALNTRLNELADSEGWCSEYERVMETIGMRNRRQRDELPYGGEIRTDRAYNIEVNVDFAGEIDYPRGTLESAIERDGNFSGSVGTVTFNASTTVTLYGVIADDEDAARELIYTARIEEEFDNLGITYSEITDWSITDVDEDEDYDWND